MLKSLSIVALLVLSSFSSSSIVDTGTAITRSVEQWRQGYDFARNTAIEVNPLWSPTDSEFDFSISSKVSYQSVPSGEPASYELTVSLISGSSQQVQLGVESPLPPKASVHFEPSSKGLPIFSCVLIIEPYGTGDAAIPPGTYSLLVQGLGGDIQHEVSHTVSLTLVVTPETTVMEPTVSLPWYLVAVVALLVVLALILVARSWRNISAEFRSISARFRAPPDSTSHSKFCVNCGIQLPGDAKFCDNCGTSQE